MRYFYIQNPGKMVDTRLMYYTIFSSIILYSQPIENIKNNKYKEINLTNLWYYYEKIKMLLKIIKTF